MSNVLTTSILLALIAVVIYNIRNNEPLKENFAGLNYPFSFRVNREVIMPPSKQNKKPKRFAAYGNNQASLPTTYTKTETCKPPVGPKRVSAFACKQVVDSCVGGVCELPCKKKSTTCDAPPVGSASFTSVLPVTDMRTIQQVSSIQEQQSDEQPIIYDRLIYACGKSRLRNGTDYIRGDLAIAPVLPSGDPRSLISFRPSVTPHIDLNQGAMNILGGNDTSSQSRMSELMNASMNGTLCPFGDYDNPVTGVVTAYPA